MTRVSKYITVASVIIVALLAGMVLASSKILFTVMIKPSSGSGDIINVVNMSGHWITAVNSTLRAKVPLIEISYVGPARMTYLRDSNNVTIEVPENFTLTYSTGYIYVSPYSTKVNITWSPPLSVDKVNLTCIHAGITEIRDVLVEIINNGTDSKLRQLVREGQKLSNIPVSELEEGKIVVRLSEPGEYICLAYLNKTVSIQGITYDNVTILGVGLLHAVKYKMYITAPKSILIGKILNVTMRLSGTPSGYRYVYFIAHKTVFKKLILKIKTNGTIPGTKIYLIGRGGSTVIVNGTRAPRELKILGKGLKATKVGDFTSILRTIFGSGTASISRSNPTSSQTYTGRLETSGRVLGEYVLYAMLVDPSTKEVLALNWTTIMLTAPPKVRPIPAPSPIVKPKPKIKGRTATYSIGKYEINIPGILTGTLVNIELTSTDKALVMNIPPFTVATREGRPVLLSSIEIEHISKAKAPPAKSVEIVGNNVYAIKTEPGNVTFLTPITVKIKIPSVGRYYIAIWNSTLRTWIPLPTEISGEYAVTHLRAPGIVALVRLKPQVVKTVSKITIEAPSMVTSGEPFTVSVKVLGPSGEPLSGKTVRLYVNGRYIAYSITGANGVATFRLVIRNVGVFTISAVCDGATSSTRVVVSPIIG